MGSLFDDDPFFRGPQQQQQAQPGQHQGGEGRRQAPARQVSLPAFCLAGCVQCLQYGVSWWVHWRCCCSSWSASSASTVPIISAALRPRRPAPSPSAAQRSHPSRASLEQQRQQQKTTHGPTPAAASPTSRGQRAQRSQSWTIPPTAAMLRWGSAPASRTWWRSPLMRGQQRRRLRPRRECAGGRARTKTPSCGRTGRRRRPTLAWPTLAAAVVTLQGVLVTTGGLLSGGQR